ncbi:hypothetical protein M8J75_013855 [Diaphorina citri]|nr:hypothetical protein M8J75_013855 [Diaphorina citri]
MLETFTHAEDIQLSSIPVSLPTQRAPSINNIYKHLDIDVAKLVRMVGERRVPERLVPTVFTQLHDIVTKCKILDGSLERSEISNIPNPEAIAPKQKLVTQFQQTLNPLKRKKKGKFVDKTKIITQREAARDNLLTLQKSSNTDTSHGSTYNKEEYYANHDYCE